MNPDMPEPCDRVMPMPLFTFGRYKVRMHWSSKFAVDLQQLCCRFRQWLGGDLTSLLTPRGVWSLFVYTIFSRPSSKCDPGCEILARGVPSDMLCERCYV